MIGRRSSVGLGLRFRWIGISAPEELDAPGDPLVGGQDDRRDGGAVAGEAQAVKPPWEKATILARASFEAA